MAKLGFALSIFDIGKLYWERKRHPKPDWINSFMKRNNLSLKEATKLTIACYNATKNLFVIFW